MPQLPEKFRASKAEEELLQALRDLVKEVLAEHAAGNVAAGKRLEHYHRAGCALRQAKDRIAAANGGSSHGRWLPWLEVGVAPLSVELCGRYLSVRQAERYVKFYEVTGPTIDVTSKLEALEDQWRIICGNGTRKSKKYRRGKVPPPKPFLFEIKAHKVDEFESRVLSLLAKLRPFLKPNQDDGDLLVEALELYAKSKGVAHA